MRRFTLLDREGCSFLKKRTKRLSIPRGADDTGLGRHGAAGGEVKVFCFFSSEKKDLLVFLQKPPRG
jgi:hypothetical protein